LVVAHRLVHLVDLAERGTELGVELAANLRERGPRDVVALRKDTTDERIPATTFSFVAASS